MSRGFYPLVVLLCAFTSGGLVWFTSVSGVGTTPDSVQYILAARDLLEGGSLGALPVHWPPLYPVMISLAGVFGLDPVDVLRHLHAILAAACTALFGMLVRPEGIRLPLVGVLVTLLFAVHPGLYSVFFMAWSEPLFILLLLLHFLCLRRFLPGRGLIPLALAGFCVGLAILTRYAGVAFAAAGMIFLLMQRDTGWRERSSQALAYGVTVSAPVIAWLIARVLADESSVPRQMVFHPVDAERLAVGLDVLGSWFLPQARGTLARMIVAALALLGVVAWVSLPRTAQANLFRALLLGFSTYIGFLLVSISLFDFYTPLNVRILAPGLVVVMAAFGAVCGGSSHAALWQGHAVGAFIALSIALSTGPLVLMAERNARSPSGYLAPAVRFTPVLIALRQIPATQIISNAPELVRLVDGRDASMLPAFYDPVTAAYRTGYVAEMDELMRGVAGGGIAVVMFSAFDWREYIPDAAVFEESLGMPPVYRGDDGWIFYAPLIDPGVDRSP